MKRASISLVVCALIAMFAATTAARAEDSAVPAPNLVASRPCQVAATPAVEPNVIAELEAVEEPSLTPAAPEDRAVTCGNWIYDGCCISQTKYRRRCQFNPGEWWYETKCQGVCMM